MPVNIKPATDRLAALVRATPDDALSEPTPCDMPVGELLDHIGMLALAFSDAARKHASELTSSPPPPDVSNLGNDWREEISRRLDALASAWTHDDAWNGTTSIGGMDMPGEAAGVIALDEVVIHGWDLARATGRPYDVDAAHLETLMGFVTHMAEPGMVGAREGLFGPVVQVPADAPLLDRVVGLTGRDPAWSRPRG
jgi:uncharacterized protein (TIGR03086 family)